MENIGVTHGPQRGPLASQPRIQTSRGAWPRGPILLDGHRRPRLYRDHGSSARRERCHFSRSNIPGSARGGAPRKASTAIRPAFLGRSCVPAHIPTLAVLDNPELCLCLPLPTQSSEEPIRLPSHLETQIISMVNPDSEDPDAIDVYPVELHIVNDILGLSKLPKASQGLDYFLESFSLVSI